MAINAQVYKELRIVPVRFERATTGDPDIGKPDLDDRGYNAKVPAVDGLAESAELRGPVVGLIEGQTIKLRLVRELIDPAAPLYLVSDDESLVTVETPAKGTKVADGARTDIAIKAKALSGTTGKSAEITVRFQTENGPIVSALKVYVFAALGVRITPHIVTIHGTNGSGGTAPAIDVAAIMTQVKAIWACCGIEMQVQTTKSWSINLSAANMLDPNSELKALTDKSFVASSVNVYIVREIAGACGAGLSRDLVTNDPDYAGLNMQPAVYLGERCGGGARTIYWGANDLAHELGHFFKLWHPSDAPTDGSDPPSRPAAGWSWARYETWSMRCLMFNFNRAARPPFGGAPWPGYGDYGYGSPFRGALIPFKKVRSGATAGQDAQCSVARDYVKAGNIY